LATGSSFLPFILFINILILSLHLTSSSSLQLQPTLLQRLFTFDTTTQLVITAIQNTNPSKTCFNFNNDLPFSMAFIQTCVENKKWKWVCYEKVIKQHKRERHYQ
jgi:hypothetical protein